MYLNGSRSIEQKPKKNGKNNAYDVDERDSAWVEYIQLIIRLCTNVEKFGNGLTELGTTIIIGRSVRNNRRTLTWIVKARTRTLTTSKKR